MKYFPDCYSYDEPCEILYAPIQATYKESQSLNGLVKMRCDREHKDSLSKHPKLKDILENKVPILYVSHDEDRGKKVIK